MDFVKKPYSLRNTLRNDGKMNAVLLSFLLGMACALAIFLPFLVVDKGFFLYCGDYNEQQIPFYLYVQGFLKHGGGTWSWATDLGSSVVNSYSFYNIGSPFLWLSLIVPNSWMPFMMVPLFMLKFGAIAAAASLYMSRYSKSRNMLVICSLTYAFCGFNVYNVFFNHMLDPVVFFPLMLWALDSFIMDNRRGLFAVFVGFALINSYFFFIGNVVFLLLYFFVKLACGEYELTVGSFGQLLLEALLGIGIGMVLALPSFLNLMGNPRISNFSNGMGLVMYGNVQQYFAIITSIFLPPDPPYMPNLFPDAAIKWTSMSLYLPIISIAGVAAYARARRGGSTKILLFISLVMALVPFLNSSFYAFNASYYARWYYMPLLIAALATLRSLEDADIDLEWGARIAVILTGLYAIFGLLPEKTDNVWSIGVAQDARKFWLTWLTAMLAVVVFYLLVRYWRHKVKFAPLLLGAVMGFSVFYSVIHISLGKFPQWERDANYRAYQYDGAYQIDMPDDEFYRVDTYNAHDNLGLWLNHGSIRTFNSTVTPSIMEFYPFVGVKRDVSSKPDTELYALRGLLSVKYTLTPVSENAAFLSAPGVQGWKLVKTEGPFEFYENENFVPLGFTYDQFVSMDALYSMAEQERSAMLMHAIGLEYDQVEEYRHLFTQEAMKWQVTQTQDAAGNMVSNGWYQYEPLSFQSYVDDCNARRATAAYESSNDPSGFRVKIKMEKENLVFFGVPYDPGFTATVNGQDAKVLRVSGGMMAVLAPEGDNEIVFTYHTPGLQQGIIITVISLLALAVYLLLWRRFGAKKVPQKVGAVVKPYHSTRAAGGDSETMMASQPADAKGKAQPGEQTKAAQGDGLPGAVTAAADAAETSLPVADPLQEQARPAAATPPPDAAAARTQPGNPAPTGGTTPE